MLFVIYVEFSGIQEVMVFKKNTYQLYDIVRNIYNKGLQGDRTYI